MGFRGDFPTQSTNSAQSMGYRSGVVVAFDKVTLENVISVGGAELSNLPILGIAEAATLEPGDVVGIMVVGSTWAIIGQLVTPGTAEALDAISLLNSQIHADFIVTGESCTSATYGDLATVGPRVTVPVGGTGRILIIATAQIQWITGAANPSVGDGRFNVEFSGANSRSPNEAVDPLVGAADITVATSGGITSSNAGIASATAQAVFTGLNPGDTTITMKYRNPQAALNSTEFFRRVLTVVRL